MGKQSDDFLTKDAMSSNTFFSDMEDEMIKSAMTGGTYTISFIESFRSRGLIGGVKSVIILFALGFVKGLAEGIITEYVQNLRYLYDTGKLEEVRIVCLPGYVDAEATVDGIADSLGDVSKVFLKLIRFRPFGVRGELEGHPAPSMAFMNRLKARAESRGFRRVLIL